MTRSNPSVSYAASFAVNVGLLCDLVSESTVSVLSALGFWCTLRKAAPPSERLSAHSSLPQIHVCEAFLRGSSQENLGQQAVRSAGENPGAKH